MGVTAVNVPEEGEGRKQNAEKTSIVCLRPRLVSRNVVVCTLIRVTMFHHCNTLL